MAEEGDESLGRFGAAIGSGAAKLGRKAAESEAGRSAGRAAVTGATEGVKQDLTNRYLGGSGGDSGTTSTPAAHSQSKPTPVVSNPVVSTPVPTPTSSATSRSHSNDINIKPQHREPRPPKPSLLSRFKPHIGKSPHQTKQRQRVRRTSQKDKVYKYNLSKEANWEEKMRVQALYNYKAERQCDLEFRKGQVFHVLTRTDHQFDWWEGKLDDKIGIFPANYVKII